MIESETAFRDTSSDGGKVHVCPLRLVPDTVARTGASHLVTCLQDEILVETPRSILANNHLRLRIHDISEPLLGHIPPGDEHIAEIIDFAAAWGGRGPMVIHCWAGISRSTAAALVTLCTLNPEVPEHVIVRRLREASPTAYPNALMIQIGDDALSRRGRLVDAVRAIGRGVPATEARPFSLPADFSTLRG
ncbi:MAG TPA: tyrosine protein phosphatase [Hyphomicrobiaceae bacterium]|jgi:predicted protein tyrosine phosphatase|nr:tyrosine protein phosphatase [Hyphomicrobiaceae bacterium]